MMEYIIVIIFLITVIVVLGFIIKNLLVKVEKYEEDVILKDEFLEKFRVVVQESYARIKEMDSRGAFESDDEVGYFFKTLKDTILALDVYYKNYKSEEEEK